MRLEQNNNKVFLSDSCLHLIYITLHQKEWFLIFLLVDFIIQHNLIIFYFSYFWCIFWVTKDFSISNFSDIPISLWTGKKCCRHVNSTVSFFPSTIQITNLRSSSFIKSKSSTHEKTLLCKLQIRKTSTLDIRRKNVLVFSAHVFSLCRRN